MLAKASFSIDYLRRLLRFSLREHPVMLANLTLAFVSVLLELAAVAVLMPLSILATGVQVQPDSKWTQLFDAVGIELTFSSVLLCLLVVFALRLITQFLNQATSIFLGKRVQADLSARAFERLVKDMSLREFDARSAGHFISLAGDETARAGAIVIAFNQLLAATLLTAVYLAAMFYFSRYLGFGVVIFSVIALVSLRGTLRRSQFLSARQLEEAKIAHSVFLDSLNGLRSVRALSAESFVTSTYEQIIRQYTTTHFLIDTLGFAARLIPALILLVCILFVTSAGRLSIASPSELAVVVTALALLMRFFPGAGQILSLLMRLLADVRAASDVTHLLDPDPATQRVSDHRTIERGVQTLELRHISFSYKPFKPVLRNFSATLRRGRSYALVGPSGSGKTTVFDLLLGFYSPDSGEVLVNDVSVQELDNRKLRSVVILVGQQVTILNDTIANNIRFGSGARHTDVKAACVAACIDEYIETLPQGYETVLSFQGSNLSGGQRQRIAIARGLLRNPNALLLDETTTGLDAETRDQVIRNILGLYRDRIVVFATHDKDLVACVDEVISLPQYADPLSAQDGVKDRTLTQ